MRSAPLTQKMTDEDKVAHKVALAHDERLSCRKKEARKMKAILNTYLGNLAALPIKEEPLGADKKGRLHWWFHLIRLHFRQ